MKKFLIIGNSNAITYKSIFPHIASGEWFLRTGKGDRHCSMYFLDDDGERKDMPALWYTNLDSRHLYQELELTKTYDPEKYPKYDNFDGIEVSKLRDIPYNYGGIMGVPISVVLFSPEQFEIVGDTNPLARGGLINGKYTYKRVPVRLRKKKDKKFLIIGNMSAITYKSIFPLIKDNKMWVGCKGFSGGMDFNVDDSTYDASKEKQASKIVNGRIVKNIMGCIWFTNMEHNKRKEPLILTKTYDPEKYPKYDNYNAINVDKVKDIPYDYDGVMGVPISFLDSYNPNQFEIKGIDRYVEDNPRYGHRFSINGSEIYARLLIKKINKNLDF